MISPTGRDVSDERGTAGEGGAAAASDDRGPGPSERWLPGNGRPWASSTTGPGLTELREDRRGASQVVGFVLVVGIAILGATVYQATVVPAETAEAEFDHSQQVLADYQDVRGAVLSTAAGPTGESVQVQVGPRYPDPPPFAFRAPPPASRIGTTSPANATVENATAVSPGPRAYWNGTDRNVSTRLLVYQPTYRRYGGAPEQLLYEHSLVAKRYDASGNATAKAVTASQQRVVLGRTLTLVTLAGEFNESTAGTANVDIRPAADGVRSVTVFNDTHPITLSVPTRLPEGTWKEALADQRVSRGGHVQAVDYQQRSGEYNRVEIRLEPDVNYTLRLGRVTIGDVPEDGDDDTGAAYVTPVGKINRTLDVGENETFTVEVRDRYDNPVSGVTVNWSVHSPGNLSARNVTTGPDGRATVVYTATSGGEARIEASFDGGPPPAYKSTNFSVDVGGGLYNLSLTVANADAKSYVTCRDGACYVDANRREARDGIVLKATTENPEVSSGLLYATNNSVAALNESSDALSSGSDTVELTPGSNGWTQVSVSAAGSTETLPVKITGRLRSVPPAPSWKTVQVLDTAYATSAAFNSNQVGTVYKYRIRYDMNLPGDAEIDEMRIRYELVDGGNNCGTGKGKGESECETVKIAPGEEGTMTFRLVSSNGGVPVDPRDALFRFFIEFESGATYSSYLGTLTADGLGEGELANCMAGDRSLADQKLRNGCDE